jgi:hypothetical protein
MSGNLDTSLQEVYSLAEKVLGGAEVICHVFDWGQMDVATSSAKLAYSLGRLTKQYLQLDGLPDNLERRINASRRHKEVDLLGQHPNAIRAIVSLANEVKRAAGGAMRERVYAPSGGVEDEEGMQQSYRDAFSRAGVARNSKEWKAFCKRFRTFLPRFDFRGVLTILQLEKAAAEQPADALWPPQSSPAGGAPPESTAPPLAAVSKPGKLILAALLKSYPTLQTIDKIAETIPEKDQISERTIGPELDKLIDNGLAERPQGRGKGAILTTKGKSLAERLAAVT